LVWSIILIYLSLGAVAGLLAGLLGVGGGAIIVPVLVYAFLQQGFAEANVMHMALGTSLGCILFGSLASLRQHHLFDAVNWPVFRRIVPGILAGTFIGSLVAAYLPTAFLKIFFALFMFYIGTQLLLNISPKPHRAVPEAPGMFAAGSVIGVISSWAGIGGGSLSVPFLAWCNVRLHEAIGTAAAIGFPIAAAGTLGYALSGFGDAQLPEYSVGYIYMPALLAIVAVSVFTAPAGARLAHRLPVSRLRKIFAVFVYLVAAQMLWSLR
jgi:uncharacterized protein